MTKNKIIFECSKCGAQALKWSGRCLECGSWGTLQESLEKDAAEKPVNPKLKVGQVVSFDQIDNKQFPRIALGIDEFDQVMGGGIVSGSLTLLGGEPGIGKSTLVLQIVEKISLLNTKQPVLYVSGEESTEQIKLRLDRLNLSSSNIKFLGDTRTDEIIGAIKSLQPSFVVIDSIQTIVSDDVPSEAGSVNQIRVNTVKFLSLAKESRTPIFIIGHITKDGLVAGPKTLEHLVDTVLYLEGERSHHFRLLRTVKNRFGATNEVGVFEMSDKGLLGVKNPSAIFLENRSENLAGSVTTVVMEGTRPFLMEVQALVNQTMFGLPQRRAVGFDVNRLQLLIAVLAKRCGIKLFNQDIAINIAGGFKIQEPAADLAVCLAIVSALQDKPVNFQTIVIGEVGLSGEVRGVSQMTARIKEAEKLGFKEAITGGKTKIENNKIKNTSVKNLTEALNCL